MGVGITTKSGLLVNGKNVIIPGGAARDKNDDKALRHGFDVDIGYNVGKYVQSPPILFNATSHNIFLGDQYLNSSLFLVCGGPSLNNNNLELLNQSGIMTMGINNSPAIYRPNLWICVDDPGNFALSIWLDPKIQKYTPICSRNKTLFDNNKYQKTNIKVSDCPNVLYYTRNEKFVPEQFLFEDSVCWGNHSNFCDCGFQKSDSNKKKIKECPICHRDNFWGSRTIMLAAMRVIFYLGFRRVYLLGADFKMEEGKDNYAFKQDRTRQSVKNNNNTYRINNERYKKLRPIFEKNGYIIKNCYKDSGLTAFDYIDFEEAIEMEKLDTSNEDTSGLYDRKAKEKEGKNAREEAKKQPGIESKVKANKETLKTLDELLQEKGI